MVPLRGRQRKQRSLEENWRNSYRESLHCLAGESLPYRLGPWRCRAFYPARQRTSGAGGCRLYDALAGDAVLGWIPEHTRKIDVGKRSGRHSKKQEEILEILLEEAKKGGTIVRLKGGDPFVFGRGGEEAEFLKKHQIPFEVVPGISSSLAVPAYFGIPVTHRGLAGSFHVITGHRMEACRLWILRHLLGSAAP